MAVNIIRAISKENIKHFFEKPERVFLTLASIFGLAMIVCMPIFMAPDESAHFYRAYEISEGHFVSQTVGKNTGDKMPIQLNKVVNDFSVGVRSGAHPPLAYPEYYTKKISNQPEVFTDFRSSALYSPVSYIPQSIGVGLGRLVYPSVGVMVTLGRIVNLSAYILLIYVAIRIAKQGKWVYAAVGLFPVAIQQAASLSSDVMTIGVIFVYIALLHRVFLQKEKLQRWQLILFALLAVALALTKQTNIVLFLPLLFLPNRVFTSIKQRIKIIGAICIFALVALVGWYMILKLRNYNLQTSGQAGVNQSLQTSYLLHHPLSYINTILHTYIYEGKHGLITPDFLITSMYGVFSWISYKLPLSFTLLGYVTLFFALFHRSQGEISNDKQIGKLSLLQIATFLASIVAIASALYLTWTPVASPQVWGLQGRYFIPLIPLLIPVCMWLTKYIQVSFKKPMYLGVLIGSIAVLNLTAMVALTLVWFE